MENSTPKPPPNGGRGEQQKGKCRQIVQNSQDNVYLYHAITGASQGTSRCKIYDELGNLYLIVVNAGAFFRFIKL